MTIKLKPEDKPTKEQVKKYKEKQEEKSQRYKQLANKHRQESESRKKSAKSISDAIPFGQPILVGHHSEKGHRRDLKRIDNNIRKGIEHDKTSEYYENKANNTENPYAISSDDPEAIIKLKKKVEKLEKLHAETKAIPIKPRDYSFSKEDMRSVYLTSYSTKIRLAKKRIDELRATKTINEDFEINGIRIFTDENRVKIEFGYKPSEETRSKLKSNGFRWSPRNQTWQSFLKPYYLEKAKEIVQGEKN